MSEDDPKAQLVPAESRSLTRSGIADNGILSEMVGVSLTLARESAVATVDLDALVQEGDELFQKEGEKMTENNIRAFNLFSRAAAAGHSEAQFRLYYCYKSGRGVQENVGEAEMWLRKAAANELPRALFHLALAYKNGRLLSIAKDEEEAIQWYQKAAETGLFVACLCIEEIYKERNNATETIRWSKEAALRGYSDSLWDVKRFYEQQNLETIDRAEAYAWLLLFADHTSHSETKSGELETLMSPAEIEKANHLYQNLKKEILKWSRKGAEREAAEARVRRKGAERGYAGAQYQLGSCYEHGSGVERNYVEAANWYRKSAEQGNSSAQFCLGKLFEKGNGVPQNLTEAANLFRKAADHGHLQATISIGNCYRLGHGVSQDYVEAVKWFRKAAEQGNGEAQDKLGSCYKNGQGVGVDLPRAYAWFLLAAKTSGHGRDEAAGLAALLSPSEFEAANALYEEIKAKYSRKG